MSTAGEKNFPSPAKWHHQMFQTFHKHQREAYLCDTLIKTGDKKEILVHAIVIASSSLHLSQQLYRKHRKMYRYTLEHSMNTLYSGDVMQQIVEFIYTGQIPAPKDNINEVKRAAKEFQLDEMLQLLNHEEGSKPLIQSEDANKISSEKDKDSRATCDTHVKSRQPLVTAYSAGKLVGSKPAAKVTGIEDHILIDDVNLKRKFNENLWTDGRLPLIKLQKMNDPVKEEPANGAEDSGQADAASLFSLPVASDDAIQQSSKLSAHTFTNGAAVDVTNYIRTIVNINNLDFDKKIVRRFTQGCKKKLWTCASCAMVFLSEKDGLDHSKGKTCYQRKRSHEKVFYICKLCKCPFVSKISMEKHVHFSSKNECAATFLSRPPMMATFGVDNVTTEEIKSKAYIVNVKKVDEEDKNAQSEITQPVGRVRHGLLHTLKKRVFKINNKQMKKEFTYRQCTVCDYCTDEVNDYLINTQCSGVKYFDYDDKVYVCKKCDTLLFDKETVSCHIRGIVHPKAKRMCYSRVDDPTSKVLVQVDAKERGSFVDRQPMIADVHMHTMRRRHEITCKFCGKKFRTNATYKMHVQKHNTQKLHACTLCDRTFKYPKQLADHVLTHTEASKPQGSVRKINQKSNEIPESSSPQMNKSLLPTTMSTKEFMSTFACAFCYSLFRDEPSFMQHLFDHNKTNLKKSGNSPQNTFACSLCKSSYNGQETLEHHLFAHNESKVKYTCNICKKEYIGNLVINDHLKKHGYSTGINPQTPGQQQDVAFVKMSGNEPKSSSEALTLARYQSSISRSVIIQPGTDMLTENPVATLLRDEIQQITPLFTVPSSSPLLAGDIKHEAVDERDQSPLLHSPGTHLVKDEISRVPPKGVFTPSEEGVSLDYDRSNTPGNVSTTSETIVIEPQVDDINTTDSCTSFGYNSDMLSSENKIPGTDATGEMQSLGHIMIKDVFSSVKNEPEVHPNEEVESREEEVVNTDDTVDFHGIDDPPMEEQSERQSDSPQDITEANEDNCGTENVVEKEIEDCSVVKDGRKAFIVKVKKGQNKDTVLVRRGQNTKVQVNSTDSSQGESSIVQRPSKSSSPNSPRLCTTSVLSSKKSEVHDHQPKPIEDKPGSKANLDKPPTKASLVGNKKPQPQSEQAQEQVLQKQTTKLTTFSGTNVDKNYGVKPSTSGKSKGKDMNRQSSQPASTSKFAWKKPNIDLSSLPSTSCTLDNIKALYQAWADCEFQCPKPNCDWRTTAKRDPFGLALIRPPPMSKKGICAHWLISHMAEGCCVRYTCSSSTGFGGNQYLCMEEFEDIDSLSTHLEKVHRNLSEPERLGLMMQAQKYYFEDIAAVPDDQKWEPAWESKVVKQVFKS